MSAVAVGVGVLLVLWYLYATIVGVLAVRVAVRARGWRPATVLRAVVLLLFAVSTYVVLWLLASSASGDAPLRSVGIVVPGPITQYVIRWQMSLLIVFTPIAALSSMILAFLFRESLLAPLQFTSLPGRYDPRKK